MYNPRLPQYGFGDWLQGNAGTIGSIAGGAVGLLGGPAGVAAGAAIGGQLGGAIQGNYEGNQMADAQSQQMQINQRNQAYQNRLGVAAQGMQPQGPNQFAGTQRFAYGGPLKDVNYNQLFEQKTSEGNPYYITRRTTSTIGNPNFTDLGESYSVFTDPKLAYEVGNLQGITKTDDNKVVFNSDAYGDSSQIKDAVFGRLSSQDLDLPIAQPQLNQKAFGGSLSSISNGSTDSQDYSGQKHKNGGVQVDRMGNPSIISGEQAIAEVEGGESSHTFEDGNVYIFSDQLTRK